jgi:hypothetical protein
LSIDRDAVAVQGSEPSPALPNPPPEGSRACETAPVKFVLSLFVAIAVAVVTGLGSVWLAVGEGLLLKPQRYGLWSAWPGAGQARPDPYSRAMVARTGQVPLGPGEAVVLFAARDEAGRPIAGGCDYRLAGALPEVRLWTLEVVDGDGRVAANPSERYYLSSHEVVTPAAGPTEVILSPRARPGNWLPIAPSGALTVILRLYDPQGLDAQTLKAMALPGLQSLGCAP